MRVCVLSTKARGVFYLFDRRNLGSSVLYFVSLICKCGTCALRDRSCVGQGGRERGQET